MAWCQFGSSLLALLLWCKASGFLATSGSSINTPFCLSICQSITLFREISPRVFKFHEIYRKHSLCERKQDIFFFKVICLISRLHRPKNFVKQVRFGVSMHSQENGLKFAVLMYLYHLQKLLDFGHGLLIFVILAQLWLSETGQIRGFCAFSGERMEGVAWNLACWCILTSLLQNWLDLGHSLLAFLILIMSDLWLHAYLTGLWGLRGAAAVRFIDLLA